ncbi:putative phage tail protein [Brevibacillus laterosporus]|uniref:putative phage tail protein n=1 Tax=Brevibacillus laterosporus TaxID=1465 RepID=UPI000EACEC86|nr:putative phage tail protein [Brevibacillus laterosporus]AYK08845.1 DUF2313 domain-containing protein [Brevibacillus laterosporus]
MGFKDFIFSFFPSGWLNPSADGNKRFFGGLGKSFDYVYDLAHQVELESSVSTAVFTLSDREIECGLAPDPSLDVEFRRARLIARTQEEDGPVNTEDFEKALGLLSNGIAKVIPDHANYSVTYHLEFSKSLTLNLLLLEEYIRRNKLAHLAHSYRIAPTTSSVQFFMPEKTTVYVSTYQECGTFVAGGEWSLA